MYNRFAITVTTAGNSSMIDLGWQTGTAFDWPNHLPKGDQKTTLVATARTATFNVSSSCAHRTMQCSDVCCSQESIGDPILHSLKVIAHKMSDTANIEVSEVQGFEPWPRCV